MRKVFYIIKSIENLMPDYKEAKTGRLNMLPACKCVLKMSSTLKPMRHIMTRTRIWPV